jgi:hypothetical protein
MIIIIIFNFTHQMKSMVVFSILIIFFANLLIIILIKIKIIILNLSA